MARWAPQRTDVIDALATEILHNYGRGRVIVAIDGRDGAGKTRFAAELAAVLRKADHAVFVASVDDFHRSKADRYARGEHDPEGYYRDAFDYSVLRRVLIEPFRMAGSTGFVTAAFDVRRDVQIEPKWQTAPADAILIVEGVFLLRPELRGLWNFSIWLEVPIELAYARMADRDGSNPDPVSPANARYVGGQALYQKDANPKGHASAVIDQSVLAHPRRVFSDSC